MSFRQKTIILALLGIINGNAVQTFAANRKAVFHAIVSIDSTGDYTSIQMAINQAPDNRKEPYRILVKDGFYLEHLEIPASKTNICLIGTNPEKVIIGESTNVNEPVRIINGKSVRSGTVVNVYGDDFHAENITFKNLWGMEKKAGPQALVMNTFADRVILKNCKLMSYQDTYLTSTRKNTDRHYLKQCDIEGAVDFIYGSGNVVFDSCCIGINRKSGGYIVAPNHSPVVPWGYVFLNCRIVPKQDSTDVWLGRPWHRTPKVVFINTVSEVSIRPLGWVDKMGGLPAIFAEYNTMDSKGNPIDLSERRTSYWNWKDTSKTEKVTAEALSLLTKEEAECYTVPNVLSGGDNWKPEQRCTAFPNPLVRRSEKELRWGKTKGAIGYLCFVNGKLVAIVDQTNLKINTKATDRITVRAVNESGGFSTTN
jgi:pectin methylesterase-like acyl-CoA thioesterase